jgi:Mg-chelatase subunit ChlD
MSVEIVMVLDRSGSMQKLASDVIGGFNSFLKEQQELKKKAKLTTILFDDRYEILHDGVDIHDVDPLTKDEYYARGMTALLDAVGKTIANVKSRTKKKDKVLFIVNTDGLENVSVEYNKEDIKKMVEGSEEKRGWKFMFLGADIDAFEEGGSIGIKTTGTFSATSRGYQSAYNAVTLCTTAFRNSDGEDWDTTALNELE